MFEQNSAAPRRSSLRNPNSPRAKAKSAAQVTAEQSQISDEEFRQQLRAAEAIKEVSKKYKLKETSNPGSLGILSRIFKTKGLVKLGVTAAIGGYFLANPEALSNLTDTFVGQHVLSAFGDLPDIPALLAQL